MCNVQKNITKIQKATLSRLPLYYAYLEKKWREGITVISSTTIANSLKLNAIQVRKDLASVASSAGKSKVGFAVRPLLDDMENMLGYNNTDEAIVVGVGKVGTLLLSFDGFSAYGLNIVAGLDQNKELHGTTVNGKKILPMDKLESIVDRLKIRIGIIAVPTPSAQDVADRLVKAGILAIWNFAPHPIETPVNILVKNENLAASLASLSNLLAARNKHAEIDLSTNHRKKDPKDSNNNPNNI